MSEEKYSRAEVAAMVDNEGLGYAIQKYLGADKIKDKKLSQMWGECADLMDAIEAYLSE